MGKDDYTSTGGGLKLKGVKSGGVEKHKKKKKTKPLDASEVTGNEVTRSDDTASESAAREAGDDVALVASESTNARQIERHLAEAQGRKDDELGTGSGKTEAERRHEGMRRKRLSERLAREGIKTHKERVEELNTYLSKLSEHHDMPRIGPG